MWKVLDFIQKKLQKGVHTEDGATAYLGLL